MDMLSAYFLKVVIVSGLLTMYYWFILRDKKFNNYNRFYLLSSMLISIVIPLLNFRFYSIAPSGNQLADDFLHIISSNNLNNSGLLSDWQNFIAAAIVFISFIFLSIFLIRIFRIYKIKKNHPNTRLQGLCLIETELEEAPFSFLRNLFWKRSIDLNGYDGQLIFNHELTHIKQRHTYDKLFSQAIVCVFWMNPFFRIMQNELALVHEFIADSKSIRAGDTVKFAEMLLKSHYKESDFDPAHSFFHSPIKRRLMMISDLNSTPYSYVRKVIILPIIILFLFMFSFTISKAQTQSRDKTDSATMTKMTDENKAKTFDKYHPQGSSPSPAEVKEIVEKIIQNPPPDRIFFINGVKTDPEKIAKLKFNMITDVQMLAPEDAVKKYGVTGERGIIVFMVKNQ
jgi:hypothetical protein